MKEDIGLSQRLQAVADMVPPGSTVADIGCDHGKAAVALIRSGKAQRAICGDISAPSLDKARCLAHECGMEDRVSLRVGDGLAVLQPGEADAAVIAGMGGMLIAAILERGAASAPDALVLSPNRDAAKLRRTLVTCGYRIADETLVGSRCDRPAD
jgi:tRNA (adenine22-N1)-methyltransferase